MKFRRKGNRWMIKRKVSGRYDIGREVGENKKQKARPKKEMKVGRKGSKKKKNERAKERDRKKERLTQAHKNTHTE